MLRSEFQTGIEKVFFTSGPLKLKKSVKEAAAQEYLDNYDFIWHVEQIREELLSLAHVKSPDYEAVLMPGSGTCGIEAVITSAIPANGLLLNIVNGAYGRRISKIARIHSIPLIEMIFEENQLPDIEQIEALISKNSKITHVAMVHCESSSGILNPVADIGNICTRFHKVFILDAMTTFGAYDLFIKELNISFLVSSPNVSLEGIPGFSFVLIKHTALEQCKYQVRSLSLDLFDQWISLKTTGQFRFTPPVQALMAFYKALSELDKEGGVKARGQRYFLNNSLLVGGLKELGLTLYLSNEIRSYLITSFLFPVHDNFSFEEFNTGLLARGYVIYPGKLSKVDSFRIGNIGQLYPKDIQNLVDAIEGVLYDSGIDLDQL